MSSPSSRSSFSLSETTFRHGDTEKKPPKCQIFVVWKAIVIFFRSNQFYPRHGFVTEPGAKR